MALLNSDDRRVLALALPALGALTVEPLYVLADTAIVGRIGTDELAGLGVAAVILSVVFAGSNFLTYGTTERVARHLGAHDDVGAAEVGVQTLWLSIVVGLVAAAAVGFGADLWVSLLGAAPTAAPHATTYLRVSAFGIPAVLVTLGAQGVLRGASNYTTPLRVLLLSNLANVALEIAFVFGFGWGVAGSAWSTVIAQTGAAIVFVVLLVPRLAAATRRRPSWQAMAPLMNAGRFLLLRVGSMLVVLTAATSLAARMGTVDGAAHSIVVSLFAFAALVLDALAIPAHTLVAEAVGGGDNRLAFAFANRVARLSVAAGFLVGGGLILLRSVIPTGFTHSADVAAAASVGILWLGIGMIPGAVAFAYDGALIGYGDYRFLGVIALVTTVLMTPLGWFAARNPSIGVGGIWALLTVWFSIRAIVNWWRCRALGTGVAAAAHS